MSIRTGGTVSGGMMAQCSHTIAAGGRGRGAAGPPGMPGADEQVGLQKAQAKFVASPLCASLPWAECAVVRSP
jgi:hypothetical protein